MKVETTEEIVGKKLLLGLGAVMVKRKREINSLGVNIMEKILAIELIQRFKATYDKPPNWAWPLKPSIPLVGQTYKPGNGLLVYASAENLTGLNHEINERFTSGAAWDRYRFQYKSSGRCSKDFFPDVGIQPMTDGGLFAAGLFIAEKLNLEKGETPRSFLETIAVSNWCKFSIKSATNKDYLYNIEKLTASLPYVVHELTLLQPRVVLIPKKIWNWPSLREAMESASPSSRFLAVSQFNASVVNRSLKNDDCSAKQLKEQLKDTLLARWMKELKRMNKDNAWRYIAMLDKCVV